MTDKTVSAFNPFRRALRRFLKKPLSMICLAAFLIICLMCVFAPYISPHDCYKIDIAILRQAPSWDHPFGTDNLGRDLFTRMLFGGRTTLRATLLAAILAAPGFVIGIFSGYLGGAVDSVISRIAEGISAIPTLLIVLLGEFLVGFGEGKFYYAMAISLMPNFIRLARSLTVSIMKSEYIEAARALGVSTWGIVFRHLFRNTIPHFIVYFTNTAAEALLLCTTLGYLGIGIKPPEPEWGGMISDNYGMLIRGNYLILIPCGAIVICALCLNLLGNGLRDAFDTETEDA